METQIYMQIEFQKSRSFISIRTMAAVFMQRTHSSLEFKWTDLLTSLQVFHVQNLRSHNHKFAYCSKQLLAVRPLSCVSCVPASCFHIWFVSCPRFMSMSLFGSRCVCVCVIVNYLVYLSPVCWVPCRLVYSLFPVFLCVCIALSYLDVVIKEYYFEVSPRLRVPRFSLLCAPWQKTRPNSKRRPFTSFPLELSRDITENSPLWELLPSNLSWSPIGSRQSNDWPIVAKYTHRMQILTSWEAV